MVILQESEKNCDGEISIGPFGGLWGSPFSYRAKNAIRKIVIIYRNDFVVSVIFEGDTDDGSTTSRRFGGVSSCENTTEQIDIVDYPSNYLTGVSGTYGCHGRGPVYVNSLKFYTKRGSEYGPYGSTSGTPFSFRQKLWMITGFHGQADGRINSIGFYLRPLSSVFGLIPKKESSSEINKPVSSNSCFQVLIEDLFRIQQQMNAIEDAVPREPGPWGGSIGKSWDDGSFSAIKQIWVDICESMNAIQAVQFQYVGRDGSRVLMPMHGSSSNGGFRIKRSIELDYEKEFLIGISGFYGPVNDKFGPDVIKSITFYSNWAKYGPFGDENGTYFTSISSQAKVVGFRGSCGTTYLHSIGVHLDYI